MSQPETRAILYEIECPLCHGEFTEKLNPEEPVTEAEIQASKLVKKTRACPLCKKEITYELPSVLMPVERFERVMRGKLRE